LKSAAVIRELLAAHREAADLIQVGAYQQGSDQRVEVAIKLNSEINGFLRQDMGEMTHLAETYTRLQELAKQAESGIKR
jgi:flagellum-specific ATP synthase